VVSRPLLVEGAKNAAQVVLVLLSRKRLPRLILRDDVFADFRDEVSFAQLKFLEEDQCLTFGALEMYGLGADFSLTREIRMESESCTSLAVSRISCWFVWRALFLFRSMLSRLGVNS
jgi:hypothetical protein